MKNIEGHHTIPISMQGEDIMANIMNISKEEHNDLHNEQNLHYYYIRKFREKINGILIPNNELFKYKEDLWQAFFSKANIRKGEQHKSLISVMNKYKTILGIKGNSFEKDIATTISGIIYYQKKFIIKILKNGQTYGITE